MKRGSVLVLCYFFGLLGTNRLVAAPQYVEKFLLENRTGSTKRVRLAFQESLESGSRYTGFDLYDQKEDVSQRHSVYKSIDAGVWTEVPPGEQVELFELGSTLLSERLCFIAKFLQAIDSIEVLGPGGEVLLDTSNLPLARVGEVGAGSSIHRTTISIE